MNEKDVEKNGMEKINARYLYMFFVFALRLFPLGSTGAGRNKEVEC